MLLDRVALDLPVYDGLLAGHYVRGPGYGRKRPEGTDDWLLIMTLAGRGRVGTPAGDLRCEPFALTLIAPGTPHDYGTSESWEILWTHFQPTPPMLELLGWPRQAPGVFGLDPSNPDVIRAAFEDVLRASHASLPRRRQFAMNSLEKLLLLCDAEVPDRMPHLDDRIRGAVEFIHGHLRHPLTLEELARRSHLSPSRFAHLFREQTGISPRQYVLQRRMSRSRELLERTALGVAEVAAEVGMDPYAFSLRFRREFGVSPREFRRSRD